ncbi:MAG: WD40 repeat domain-containing protein [Chloroflexi bacterium]|nr:WD40 repeat domain-containing protein [Chloroflexota bacterium]
MFNKKLRLLLTTIHAYGFRALIVLSTFALNAAVVSPVAVGAATGPVDLEPVWVRVGDSAGEIDQENDTASIEAAEFSPDGNMIISGAKEANDLVLWDVVTGDEIWRQAHQAEIESLSFSPDGNYIASGGEDNLVRVWRVSDGEQVATLEHTASIEGMRFSHSGAILATGDESGRVNLWDTSSVDPTAWTLASYAGHGDDVNSVDFTTDDEYLVSGGRNNLIRIWRITGSGPELRLERVRHITGHGNSVKSVRISPDNRLIASAAANGDDTGDCSVRVWDFETGEQLQQFDNVKGMEAVEWTPDGQYLLTGGREGKGDTGIGNIRIYAVPSDPTEPFTLVHMEPVFRQEYLHFNSAGTQLVSSHEDGTVRLWNFVPSPAGATGD